MELLAYSRQKSDSATRRPLPHNEMLYGYFEVHSASKDCRSILERKSKKSYNFFLSATLGDFLLTLTGCPIIPLSTTLKNFFFFSSLVLVTNRKAQKTFSLSLSLSLSGAALHSQGGGGGEGVCLLVVLRAGVGARARASLWKRANKIWLLQYPCSRVRFRSSAYRKFVCSTCLFWSPSCSSRMSSACALTSSASVDRSILPKHS